jgi:hypothetical protein
MTKTIQDTSISAGVQTMGMDFVLLAKSLGRRARLYYEYEYRPIGQFSYLERLIQSFS